MLRNFFGGVGEWETDTSASFLTLTTLAVVTK